jgi:hypothetical protein
MTTAIITALVVSLAVSVCALFAKRQRTVSRDQAYAVFNL